MNVSQISDRKTYNKIYYSSHPELKERAKIRERKKRAAAKAFHNSTEPNNTAPSPSHGGRLEGLVFFVVTSIITFLLLREMAEFYAESESIKWVAWAKALALESAVVTFSFFSHTTFLRRTLYKVIACAICLLSVYAMCSKQLTTGLSQKRADIVTQEAIADLKLAITEKRAQREELKSKGWITAAHRLDRQIDELRTKLEVLRNQSNALLPAQAVTHSTLVQILFRVLLMVANILALQRLGENVRTMKTNIEIYGSRFEKLKSKAEISNSALRLQKRTNRNGYFFDFYRWLISEKKFRPHYSLLKVSTLRKIPY